jgi:hypothetical protein
MSHLYFIVYYYYFSQRMAKNAEELLVLRLEEDADITEAINDSFINFYLVLYATIIALELVKVQETIGQISKVAEGVLGEVVTLFVFMLGWVIAFSMLHRVVGNNVDPTKGKYPNLDNQFSKYFLHTWAMSTGGG